MTTVDSERQDAQSKRAEMRRRTKKETEGYFNTQFSAQAISVFAGTHKCSDDENVMLVTTLGSCISVCIHDPIGRRGGMNHFMMPDAPKHALDSSSAMDKAARYGLAAMEFLINDLMIRGTRKDHMQLKIFGGANVIKSATNIGTSNIKFVHEFIKNEGYKIIGEDTGGNLGRRIHFFPVTGKVMRRFLKRSDDLADISKEEISYRKKIKEEPAEEKDLMLFFDDK